MTNDEINGILKQNAEGFHYILNYHAIAFNFYIIYMMERNLDFFNIPG